MSTGKAYSIFKEAWRMHCRLVNLTLLFNLLFVFMFPLKLAAQDYDEILLFIDVKGVGAREIPCVIRGNELYLPVTDLFDFLRIRNVPEQDLSSVSGFFISPEAKFVISRTENKIVYQDQTYNLQPGDLIRTESNLYLKSSYFGKVFGLDCTFDFRNMAVSLTSKLELPLIREMRLEEMRKNLSRLKGEVKADTVFGRTYPLFKFGMADWSAIATEEIGGSSDTRLNLSLGGMVAGGEATANLYYNSLQPFTEKQQNYLWRYVNNDFRALRQVMAGKITSNSISSVYNPIIGARITNAPTTYRRSFGSYTLSDRTEPGWIVELYVNNELVDYVKADASGFFTFQVPLVYGTSLVKLKFYGPWGEERVREQNISIPFSFLPEKTLEYTASAGIVEDTLRSRYSRVIVNYGLTKRITFGGGVEYLSSVTSGPTIPFLSTSLRILNNLLFSGQYAYKVMTKGTLSYKLPSNMQLDLNYTWYDKDQTAILYNYRQEGKATLSVPIKMGKLYTYQRFSYHSIVLPVSSYTTGEWMFSGSLGRVNTNITTYAIFIEKSNTAVYSNFSFAFRLPADLILMPQAQVNYRQKQIISTKLTAEKRLFEHGYLNLSYERLFVSNDQLAQLGFRYDFSFAQLGASVRQSNKRTSMVQYARGSIIADSKTKYLGTDNRTNVGRGVISVTAFLDMNGNGRKDPGEQRVTGLNIRARGGRIEKSDRDSTIRIFGLEPYTSCFIELDPNGFENIAWRLPYKTISVAVDPDIVKEIAVPVIVVGEATGNIMKERNGIKSGLGGIILDFYGSKGKPAGRSISENDGYYSYFGFAPGSYFVRPDTAQLNKLGMRAYPDSIRFEIRQSIEGDFVSKLDFTLRMTKPDTAGRKTAAETTVTPSVRKDTAYMVVHELTRELDTIENDIFALQMGAFKTKSYAENYRKRIENILGRKLDIIVEDGFYKIRLSDIPDRAEVDKYLDTLKQNGITLVWVINFKESRNRWREKAIEDSLAYVTTTVVEKPLIITTPIKSIQIGAFREESRAVSLRKEVEGLIRKPVVIVQQNGFYKVRITDFANNEEMKAFLPSLDAIDLHNKRVIQGVKRTAPQPEKVRPEYEEPPVEAPVRYEHVFELPKYVPDSLMNQKMLEERDTSMVGQKAAEPELPKISLQVGVYRKYSQARRAKRRISTKLQLPVEIIPQWNYWRVLITGFHSKEETYKYYPELAGIGYPGVTIIEE